MSDKNRATDDDHLLIRAAPAPVKRFNKKAIAVVFGGAALLVLGSFSLALSPKSDGVEAAQRELYSTQNKRKADGLSDLPMTYASLSPDVPQLGPALPGDLGAPILAAHREGRLTLEDDVVSYVDVLEPTDRPSAEELAAAERALAARESALFFSNRPEAQATDQAASVGGAGIQTAHDPFEALNALQPAAAPTSFNFDPNYQGRKEEFVASGSDNPIYNPHRIEHPLSPWQVMAGTVIAATLLTGINSDLPGQVIGQVTEPVYDTVTGKVVLIPQGSRLIGRYDNVIAYGQSRALIVWNRIIMPDGTSIRIENLPGVDGRGNAGLKDRVDNHTVRIFSAAALSSLISIGSELSADDDENVARALRDATQDGASRVGDEVIRRQLAVQPTITIRPGWRFRILVHQDLVMTPYGDPQ
jgi:type IV secretion system protein VirB10